MRRAAPRCGYDPPLWKSPQPTEDPKRRRNRKMPEATKIQKPTSKDGETASLPDIPHYYREYLTKDNWYCLMAQLFHMPSVLDSLPENWCLLIKANRAHMMIMLREAGAGHDPFGGSEWAIHPSPGLGKPSQGGTTPQPGRRQPLRARLQMGRPGRGRPEGRQPLRGQPQLGQTCRTPT